jgi:hypothetical protein
LDYSINVGPLFALAATIMHIINTYISRNSSRSAKYSAAAAVSTIAIVPFTKLLLAPTNKELFKREKAARGTATGVESSSVELVKKWGCLNLTRFFFPAAGALIACFTL